MTNYIKKLLAAVTLAGAVFVTPVMAEERTDCIASMTEVITANQNVSKTFKAVPVTPEEQSAVIEKNGPPPVVPPFSLTVISDIAGGEEVGAVVIHDKDCALMVVGPGPIGAINSFLGRREASL